MTRTLPAADIRGYYTELGIAIRGWAKTEAAVRCFADPDRHERADRNPSMSINLIHGAYHCHACCAAGGAYDAALLLGHTPRSAIGLMITHGLTQPRDLSPSRQAVSRPRRSPARRSVPLSVARRSAVRRLTATDRDVAHYHQRLRCRPDLRRQLAKTRGWSDIAINELQLGLDNGRITIPVRDEHDQLVALLRYHPGAPDKLRAATGSRRVLYPHPSTLPPGPILLVEGEPDRIAAHSAGLPAIALPGVDAWQQEWAPLFADREVTVVLDCDPQGRAAARRIAEELRGRQIACRIVDLEPDRTDGYDLTDLLLDGKRPEFSCR
jgi:hypothetical protein